MTIWLENGESHTQVRSSLKCHPGSFLGFQRTVEVNYFVFGYHADRRPDLSVEALRNILRFIYLKGDPNCVYEFKHSSINDSETQIKKVARIFPFRIRV